LDLVLNIKKKKATLKPSLVIDILIKDLEMRAMKRYLDDTDWNVILEMLSEDELMELNKYYDMKGIKR
jgi:hypothetical protein